MTSPLKLFISYSTRDSAQVDTMVARLASIPSDDKTLRYEPWQNKSSLVAGKSWWDAIVDAIIECDAFIFNISRHSLESSGALAELAYAYRRNRPIVPIVLQGQHHYDTTTGHDEIDFWDQLPNEIMTQRAQLLFYKGTESFQALEKALAEIRKSPRQDIDVPRPRNPTTEGHKDSSALYNDACEYANQMALSGAESLFLQLANDEAFGATAREWLNLLHKYAELVNLDQSPNTQFMLPKKWEAYITLFPKEFLNGIFDPRNIAARIHDRLPNVPPEIPPVHTDKPAKTKPAPRPDLDALFVWLPIPAGSVSLKSLGEGYISGPTFDVKAFSMEKYPVTNEQYAKFVEEGGYKEKSWWTEDGWHQRQQGKWTQPRYWTDEKWNQLSYPVVGVSWYEAIAFAHWLSERLGKRVSLPTEQRWQRAAQGNEELLYPWSNNWNNARCNSGKSGFQQTTPVKQYEDKGASPFGVVDMAGNVWEWCLNDFNTGQHDPEQAAQYRTLKGGSWNSSDMIELQTGYRVGYSALSRGNHVGFRCVIE